MVDIQHDTRPRLKSARRKTVRMSVEQLVRARLLVEERSLPLTFSPAAGAVNLISWAAGNRLRTRQVCPAARTHPETGEWTWFNQAHLFHISGLKPEVHEAILEEHTEETLPRNAYYGDGTPIEDLVMDSVRAAIDRETVTFPWRADNIMVLDNMLAAHGRRAFAGPRKVVVGMVEASNIKNED